MLDFATASARFTEEKGREGSREHNRGFRRRNDFDVQMAQVVGLVKTLVFANICPRNAAPNSRLCCMIEFHYQQVPLTRTTIFS